MKAYRIPFALLILIFYSSCTQDDFLSENENIVEYNKKTALVENSRATQATIDLADFFQDYNFDQGTEVRLSNKGTMITYPSFLNRNDKIVVVHEHPNSEPSAVLEQKGNELLVYNEQLVLSSVTNITAQNPRDFVNCLLALAEYSLCIALIVDDVINNPLGFWGTLWNTNPAGFIIEAAVQCEIAVIQFFGIWNQLGCLLPIPL